MKGGLYFFNISLLFDIVEDREEFKEINSKIEHILGKAILETYKIEVEEMIS
jgi:hypothetical protein